ncbi:hypothetical protein [Flavobacterium okayamense]|uniref:Substrate import-associated zinc metallohydrolase lipoprotein n=1 Tax=Flavobacterium okayamense TaxID=2830782 RepID=A0ABN6HYU6_9FLAO|nr:hypothetical protein [Flavobacterium okayamense]BCY29593.1 hypothetical protein KK2020170_24610 [Flavobacterium okayamense]
MKNKFKFLIASLSIAMLFLSSCEKEIYDDAIYKSQQPQNLSISKISFKELKSNKNVVEKIKSVMTKKLPTSIANRAVYNEDFGVLIDTTNIVQMTSATEQSITFNIVDYTDSTKKENLVLVSKNDGNFEAYIAEYNLTQQDLDILASGGTLQNIQPTSISEIENASKIAVSGACVSSYTYTYSACYNSSGDIIFNNGELGNGCVGMGFDYEMQVITIDMACLADGGGGGTSGTSGTSGTGTSGTGTTGSGPTGGSTNTGSNNPNPNQSILDLFNTTFVPCTSCLEFNQTLSNFLVDLSPEQLEYWNDLSAYPRIQQTIVDYLEANNSSTQSIAFAINAIEDLNNNECTILPSVTNPLDIVANFDSSFFGSYPEDQIEHDHDAIQQQFNIIRSTQGNLAAVTYLINIYDLNNFRNGYYVNTNYTITFENGLSNGAHANAIRQFTNGVLTSCNLEIDTNLFSISDFGYITRVIKHELLHVLQGEIHGQTQSVALQEFQAYYNQLFGFTDLKKLQDVGIVEGLLDKLIENMNQLSDSEKLQNKRQIDFIKLHYPELCKR